MGAELEWLEEVQLPEGEIEWGEFMHIQVCIDITKPMLRCKHLNIGLTESV